MIKSRWDPFLEDRINELVDAETEPRNRGKIFFNQGRRFHGDLGGGLLPSPWDASREMRKILVPKSLDQKSPLPLCTPRISRKPLQIKIGWFSWPRRFHLPLAPVCSLVVVRGKSRFISRGKGIAKLPRDAILGQNSAKAPPKYVASGASPSFGKLIQLLSFSVG
jgi:hypothetical protein